MDLSGLNDDKIYYELDKIDANRTSIENYLFEQTYKKRPESYGFVNYDLTTSYFVGYKCNLSAFGKGKKECHGRRQVLLGVLINDQGYPFKWDVFPGNTAEVKTLKHNINACKTRFKLSNRDVTLVFDRGIISDDNADLIGDAETPENQRSIKLGTSILAERPFRSDLKPHPNLPDDTRLWAALQETGGGTWSGCVFDVDAIVQMLKAGKDTLQKG